MSSVVRIPNELQSFLNLPGPQTLLLRGPPGSGKTTLSLALLEAFKGDRFLVTSRVPGEELGREFPWLGENGGRSIRIIDTSGTEDSVHDIARTVRRSREHLLAPAPSEARAISEFLWLPSPLQRTWSQLAPDRPSLVVIDSWDALVEGFLGGAPEAGEPVPDRPQIERLLIRRMGLAPAHLVFVLEREEQTSLDYLVNAVVVTRREASDERLARWMTIQKLRGVRIESPNYPFSLEGAKFEGILPVRAYQTLRAGPPDPETEQLPGLIWPGSRDFAASFGRLPLGKITLLEVDPDASPEVANLLCLPIVAHVLREGGRVLIVPQPSEAPGDIWEGLNGSVPRSRFLSHVRMLAPAAAGGGGRDDLASVVLPLPKPEPGKPLRAGEVPEAIRFLVEGANERSPGLILVSLRGLLGLARGLGIPLTPELFSQMPEALNGATRAGPIHMILVGRKGSELMDELRPLATIRLALRIQQGRIFVHGIAPWTPNFVLAEGSPDRPYALLRVV